MKKLLTFAALLLDVGCSLTSATPSAVALATTWLQEIQPHLETEAQATHTMTALLDYPTLGDSVWTALATAQITKYREADTALREIVPPEKCRETHGLLLSASEDGLLGMEHHISGVLRREPHQLKISMECLDSASAKLGLAEMLMEDIAP